MGERIGMDEALLLPGFFIIALLYASVGYGGATGYIALLTLLMPALPAREVSTTALILNTLVSGIALLQFAQAGHFPFRLAASLLVASVPTAYVGGLLKVSPWLFHSILGFGLALAAIRLAVLSAIPTSQPPRPPSRGLAFGIGGLIGLISGMVGIGGGVFLSPLMILRSWASPRDTAGVAASFVLFNSLSGLLARGIAGTFVVGSLLLPTSAAVLGGVLGAYLGARRWRPLMLNRVLAIVLFVASMKLGVAVLR